MKPLHLFFFYLSLFLGSNAGCTTNDFQSQSEQLAFVHGANFSGNSFEVTADLLSSYKALLIDLPGRNDNIPFKDVTLDLTSKVFCRELSKSENKKVVIAHSQGGAVVNHALGICHEKISKIIYIAAVVPFPGEKPFDQLSKADEKNYFSGIDYVTANSELKIARPEKFLDTFAQDANEEQRKVILELAVSEPSPLAEGVLNYSLEKLNKIEKYYIFTEDDKIVSMDSQLKTTRRLSFVETYKLKSGHLPMVTKADELHRILERILSN